MTLIEEAVYATLNSNAAVKAIVGENIYPVTMPQLDKDSERDESKKSYPAIVFTLIERKREQTHQGPTRLVRSLFSVECLGREYLAHVKPLAEKVRFALNGKSAPLMLNYMDLVRGVFLEDEGDDYVFDDLESLALYRVQQNYLIQHWEALA
jgi:hypothetical protein